MLKYWELKNRMHHSLKRPLQYVIWSFLPVLISVTFCYFFVDRPVARWVQHLSHVSYHGVWSSHFAVALTQVAYALMLVIFLVYFYFAVKERRDHWVRALAVLSVSVSLTFFVKTNLQFLFGRLGPRYVDSNVLLFVRNPRLYGFHWLHNGGFPSGHMAMLSAGLMALTLFYPKLKWLMVLLLFIMAGTLLILNYHFVSDLIFGTYLGISLTLAVYYLQEVIGSAPNVKKH